MAPKNADKTECLKMSFAFCDGRAGADAFSTVLSQLGAARNVVGMRGAISSNVKLSDHAVGSIR